MMMTREEQEDIATTCMGMTVQEISEMCEFMAVELEKIGDEHGAQVLRLFKDTMNESFITVLKQKVKMQ